MAIEQPPAIVTKLNQGKLTDAAIGVSGRIVGEMADLIVGMYDGGQTSDMWQRFIDLTRELDEVWGELDLAAWAIGQLSPWAPQVRDGEPTLAQLAAPLFPNVFVPGEPTAPQSSIRWTWDALTQGLEFLKGQEILSTGEWNATVLEAESTARRQPITLAIGSQIDAFRKHLIDAHAEGDTLRQFKKRIAGTITSTAAAVERNFRTSSKRAYLDGVQKITNTGRFPYVKYVATEDNRTRPDHRAMDGKILRVGTPEHARAVEMQKSYNCRCALVALTREQAIREGLKEDGPVLETAAADG